MRAARLAGLVARQRPRALRRSLLAARIAQASRAAPQLGGNIRLDTRKLVVGGLGPDGAFEIPIREVDAFDAEHTGSQRRHKILLSPNTETPAGS